MKSSRSKLATKLILQVLLVVSLMDAILLGVAGRLDWLAAWVLSLMYFLFLVIVLVWKIRNATDLLEERSKASANAKAWDKLLLRIYILSLVALPVTAALDAGQFRWSAMPPALQALGAAGFFATGGVIWSCIVKD